jgi:hypothetical protein
LAGDLATFAAAAKETRASFAGGTQSRHGAERTTGIDFGPPSHRMQTFSKPGKLATRQRHQHFALRNHRNTHRAAMTARPRATFKIQNPCPLLKLQEADPM